MRETIKKFLFSMLLLAASQSVSANGCTGSWFSMVYSPWCNCWQVCGNYISDCDEVVSISWNFGDGTTAQGENPCHQFPGPGTYTVTMTIVAYCHNSFFNLFTSTCHITQQVVVPVNNIPLTANFTSDTTCFGTATQFTNTTVGPGGNNTYTWVFPDGSTSNAVSPFYAFDSCGAFDVMLIVQNQTPCCTVVGSDTIIQRVFVDCTPFAQSNTLGETEPYIVESFATIDVLAGTCAGDTTNFLLTPSGPIINWQWNFPDSTTSTSATPSFVYYDCPPAINYTTVNLWTDQGCLGIIDSVTGIFCPSNIGLSYTEPLCTGQCSATATTTLSGGTPPYTVQWSDPQSQTTATAINLCPGNYTVTVTDGNGCTATPNPVLVTDFAFPFIGTISAGSTILCYGDYGGSAVLNMTGGTLPYAFFWANGVADSSVTGLQGGNTNVTATDGHGCVFVGTAFIWQPDEIGANITTTNAACGLCNGSANAEGTGGHFLFNYTWLTTPQQSTAYIGNLCAGVYLVEVEDATVPGCLDTVSALINENGAQPITPTATNATCSNLCDGTATVNFTGGCLDPPCTVQWLDSMGTPLGQSGTTATGLCHGSYLVHVINGIGCNSYAQVSVSIPNPIVPNLTTTVNSCGSNCNGSITAAPSGGTPPYSFAWLDAGGVPIAGQSGATIFNLCTGNYLSRITDLNGCVVTTPVGIYGNPFVSSASSSPVACNGNCSGIITAVSSAGTTPYSYTLLNASGGLVYSGSSFIMANLCAGNYTLNATDAGGCTVSNPISVSEPAALSAVTLPTDALCFGACNGSALVNVSGGTSPYTYEWRNGVGTLLGTGSSVSALCAGGYAVQITDSLQCTTPFIPVVVGQPALLSDSIVVIDPYCAGGQGAIDLTPFGGINPYTFSWNSGAYNTEDINGLSSGTFSVQITDLNGCIKNDSVTFTLLPLMTTTITPHLYNGYHFKCFGGVDGEVVLDVTGGLPPYTYLWSDSAASTSDSIYGLPPGTYYVTVTDANGCQKPDSVMLNLIPPPFSISINAQNLRCHADSSGIANVLPVGGVPPYIYYWNVDTTEFNSPLTNIDTGTYVVYVFDSVFCLRLDTVTITQPTPLSITHTVVNATCAGLNNGSIDITVGGGTVPYAFDWNSGTYFTEDLTAIGGGSYSVLVTDSNGCTITDSAIVTQPQAMTLSHLSTDAACFGEASGSVDLTVTGAAMPSQFNWNNGQFNSEDLQNIAAGTYTVLVTDNNNCTAADTALINEPPQITGSRQVSVCISDSFFVGGAYQTAPGVYIDTLTAATGCDSVLSTNLSFISEFQSQFNQTICYGQWFYYNGNYYNAQGTYTDTLQSAAGCDSVVSFNLSVLPDLNLSAQPGTAKLLLGDSITVQIVSNAASGNLTYTWIPSEGLSCADCPLSVVSPAGDTRYIVIGVDTNGCSDTVLVPIFVRGPVIFIPNVFTPNGDGANDFFEVFGNLGQIKYLSVEIFDRWGEKVFESNDHNFKWDGTFKGKPMMPAVFVYQISVAFIQSDGPEKLYKGSVTLMK